MGRGLLTGKFDSVRLAGLADDDHRKRHPLFQEPKFGRVLDFVEQLKDIANRNSITLAQLSIAWVLRRSEVTAAIVGARRAGQISETVVAGNVELSQEDVTEINNLIKDFGV
jgi:aryl-alcohol dehydrogenase-like predicted oxidoreductase